MQPKDPTSSEQAISSPRPRVRPRFVLGVIIAAAIIAVAGVIIIRSSIGGNEKTLLSCSEGGAQFVLIELPGLAGRMLADVQFKRDGVTQIIPIGDATFGTASFLKSGDWVLIANDGNVLAAYNLGDGRQIGASNRYELPTLKAPANAKVLASKKIRETGVMPGNYPPVAPPPEDDDASATQPATAPATRPN